MRASRCPFGPPRRGLGRASVAATVTRERSTGKRECTTIAFMGLLAGLALVMAAQESYCKGHSYGEEMQAVYRSSTQNIIHVRKGTLPPGQRDLLHAIGDRLEIAGKERQTITAVLQRYSRGQPLPASEVFLVYELPGLLRLENPDSHEVVVFNGSQTQTSARSVSKEDSDVVESLVYDSVEGFISGELSGADIRLVGRALQIRDNRSSYALSGVCTLYESTRQVLARNTKEQIVKTYCFDFATQLLKTVTYRLAGVTIETRFMEWTQVGDQTIPGKVVRLENDSPVFTLTVQSIAISEKRSDNVFSHP